MPTYTEKLKDRTLFLTIKDAVVLYSIQDIHLDYMVDI
jgi:hypothetical protein